jgi:conjugative transfer signal peptidase TraF
MPLGFYRQDEGGTFAELCPPGEWGPLSAARGYRAHAIIDRCGDGSIPLLKPVVATFGDRVDVSTAGVTVNGVVLPNSAALASDAQGRPLQHVPFGQYLVGPGQVWVISTFSPRSFDSRYFGPVQAASIRRMKALLLF